MKLILTEQQYKLLLKEAKIPTMKDVLGNSKDTFIETFGENAAGQLQELIADIFGNKENYTEKQGNIFLISASGGEIPFEEIKKYLQSIADGASFDEYANGFPRKLQGNTVVRQRIAEILVKNNSEIPTIETILGETISDFTKEFGNNALIRLQSLLNEIFANKANYGSEEGNIFLISESGSIVPLKKIKEYLKLFAFGVSVDKHIGGFPRILQGGTIVRQKVIDILKKTPKDLPYQEGYKRNKFNK